MKTRLLFILLIGFSLSSLGQVRQKLSKPNPAVPTTRGALKKAPAQPGAVLRAAISRPVTVTVSGSFTLPVAARATLGVYAQNGELVRTVYAGVQKEAGTYTETWDGKNDLGETLPEGDYKLRLQTNNVQYKWMGVLGNTSFNRANPAGMQKGYRRIQTMVIVNGIAYFGNGYAEGHPSQASFDVSNPQVRIDFFRDSKTGQATRMMCSDGIRVYAGGPDIFSVDKKINFIFGWTVSTNAEYSFTGGGQLFKTAQGQDWGETYKSALVITDTAGLPKYTDLIKGMAVQKTGNYLFASLGSTKNVIRIWHKVTGAFVADVPVTSPGALAIDALDDNKLWVTQGTTVSARTIGAGSLSSPVLTLAGLVKPMAMACRPGGGELAVCDGGSSQRVMFYNPATGAKTDSLGVKGGYRNDPSVSFYKFYFDDPALSIDDTYLAYQADGSFWVGDDGNYRNLRFSAAKQFVDHVSYMENCYTTGVDKANPTRLFGQYMEFSVSDYANLTATSSWTLVKNYRSMMPSEYFENEYNRMQNIFQVNILQQVITIGGHTYGLIQRFTDKKYAVVELMPSAPLKFTGLYLGTGSVSNPNSESWVLLPDGSLGVHRTSLSGGNGTATWYKRPFLGVDGSGNPGWGAEIALQSVAVTPNDPFPVYGGSEPFGITTDGTIAAFNSTLFNPTTGAGLGYHLGGVRANKWQWKGALATHKEYKGDFPADGGYDIGNSVQYGGGNAPVAGNDIFWTYHGEFWKGSQTNKFNHVRSNGLFVGTFGVTGPDAVRDPANNPGMAGNVFGATAVPAANGNIYLFHGEEYGWSGIHGWEVSGLSTIQTQEVTATVSNAPDPRGIPIFGGLPKYTVLASGTAGLIRSPLTDDGEYTVRTNALTYAKIGAPDFYFQNNNSSGEKFATVPFSTATGVTSWTVSFTLQATQYYPSVGEFGQANSGGGYIRILDNTGKILVQYFQKISGSNTIMGFNGVTAYTRPGAGVPAYVPITLESNGTTIKCTYGSYGTVTVPRYDNTASLTAPAAVQVFSWVNGNNTGRVYGLLDAWFRAN
ncbi:FlgD immunoglobulin-like domain containing protein [Spirosoma sp.]|uniref:FlgD immunoglobulin-like domain containing protein n=1 Tax=Spirosoma sp. TaxID=1899569 RepID=UPI00261EC505|nr:FlgD immunoglobulin-like domain containing protein [Spirosoma sp.]MCX6216502.1 hypothetical protein [Spirosoma sp.]